MLAVTGWLFYSHLTSGFRVETNILKLLPKTEVDPFAEEAFTRFSDNNFKQIIVAVSADDKSQVSGAAKQLISQLKQTELIASFTSQLTQKEQEAVGKLYFDHRFHLLTDRDRQLMLEQGSQPFLDATLQLVYSPLSGQLIGLIPTDPYLLSYRYLQNLNAKGGKQQQGQLDDGFILFEQEEQYTALISATLQTSPFDTHTQDTVTTLLHDFEQNNPELTLLKTGAVFYAQHAAASAKQEISTIGLGSLIAVILLLIVAFRSTAPLLLTLTSLASGIFIAFTVVHWFFGSIHVLTLVFGSSLVGVAVDYAFHYFASANKHRHPLRHILIAISMGLVSSVIGYIALFTAPFPGLRQMALFCATGLAGAFLTVVLLFDRIPYRVATPNWLLRCFKSHLRVSRHASNNTFILMLLLAPLTAGYLLLNTEQDNDNIRQLQSIPPELYQQEQQIKELVNAPATNQFFVVKAENKQLLLEKLQQLEPQLQQLVSSAVIDGYQHPAQFVPSAQQQRNDYQLLGKRLLNDNFQQLLELGLLQPAQISKLKQNYQQQTPLGINEWLNSPLGQRFNYLWLGQIEQQQASIITLNNIHDLEALQQAAQAHDYLYFINKVEKISTLFANYRELALLMLLTALGIIFILLTVKYRPIIAAYVLLGPVIAAAFAVIVNISINGSFNLFSTLALFLVFGIGIDYGLFYAEAKTRSSYINLAIGLSAITTLLSFGLLSLSATPAIHAFGLTMLTGILTVFLLSPILGHLIYSTKGLPHE